jgi:hypothetical protein
MTACEKWKRTLLLLHGQWKRAAFDGEKLTDDGRIGHCGKWELKLNIVGLGVECCLGRVVRRSRTVLLAEL